MNSKQIRPPNSLQKLQRDYVDNQFKRPRLLLPQLYSPPPSSPPLSPPTAVPSPPEVPILPPLPPPPEIPVPPPVPTPPLTPVLATVTAVVPKNPVDNVVIQSPAKSPSPVSEPLRPPARAAVPKTNFTGVPNFLLPVIFGSAATPEYSLSNFHTMSPTLGSPPPSVPVPLMVPPPELFQPPSPDPVVLQAISTVIHAQVQSPKRKAAVYLLDPRIRKRRALERKVKIEKFVKDAAAFSAKDGLGVEERVFETPGILERVFNLLDEEDKKSFRLVNKTWAMASSVDWIKFVKAKKKEVLHADKTDLHRVTVSFKKEGCESVPALAPAPQPVVTPKPAFLLDPRLRKRREMERKQIIQKHLNDRLNCMGAPLLSQEGTPEEKALSTPKILRNIFDYLQLNSQKEFRLVSKIWLVVTLEKWRKNVKVHIGKDYELDLETAKMYHSITPIWSRKYSNRNRSGAVLTSYEYFALATKASFYQYQTTPFPFQNFLIIEHDLRLPPVPHGPRSRREPAIQFFDGFGPPMISLELVGARFPSKSGLIDGIRWLALEKCKNLKELSICYGDFYNQTQKGPSCRNKKGPEVHETADELIKLEIKAVREYMAEGASLSEKECQELFKLVPNLKILKINEDFSKLVDHLKNPLPSGSFIKLSTLHHPTCAPLSTESLSNLQKYVERARPKLRNLQFGVTVDNLRQAPLHFDKILEDCSRYLTKLSLKFLFYYKMPSYWITHMSGRYFPHLTHLRLKGESKEKNTEAFAVPIRLDFRMLLGMPKLRVLEIVAKDNFEVGVRGAIVGERVIKKDQLLFPLEGKNPVQLPFNPLKNLEELFFFVNERLDVSALNQLHEWMPLVKKLGLILDTNTFPVALELFENLEKLTLLHGSNCGNGIVKVGMFHDRQVEIVEMDNKFACFDNRDLRQFK